MKLNVVGKGILLVGVVLLSLTWLGQPALADDDDDDECAPLIEAVHMNFVSGVISIWGGFCAGEDPPEVTLCGAGLTVIDYSPTEIVADASYDPEGVCVLSVCAGDDDGDDDGACHYFWLAPAPGGPDDLPPAQAWYGVVVTQLMAPDGPTVGWAAQTVHLKIQIDGNDVESFDLRTVEGWRGLR